MVKKKMQGISCCCCL